MNCINQITQILNTLYTISSIKINCITVEQNTLIIDFSYTHPHFLAQLYNLQPGGYLALASTRPAAQLTFTLTQPDTQTHHNTTTPPFAYPYED